MAADKPEVVLSQVVDRIKTRFQHLPHNFPSSDALAIFLNLSDTTAILYFRLPVTSDIIGDITVELLDAENIELAVEIVFYLVY